MSAALRRSLSSESHMLDALSARPGDILGALRPSVAAEPASGIVDVFNYAQGKPGVIPLWVGQGHLPTPDFIAEAAIASLKSGETFYTWQRGIPELPGVEGDRKSTRLN